MKTNKILLLALLIVMLSACLDKVDYKEYKAKRSIETNSEDIVFKNYDYVNKCRNNYKNARQIGDGKWECANNDIKIEVTQIEDNMGLDTISFYFDDINKLVEEVNTFLESQSQKKVKKDELIMVMDTDKFPIINDLYFVFQKKNNNAKYDYLYIQNTKTKKK